jgi:hypothetical protein
MFVAGGFIDPISSVCLSQAMAGHWGLDHRSGYVDGRLRSQAILA